MSYKASENEIYSDRVMASGDANAIKAMRMGAKPKTAIRAIQDPGVFAIGIDLMALDVLGEHPWRQLGAAAIDAGTAYAAYWAIDEFVINSSNSDDRQNGGNTSGGDTIVIEGDGNTVDNSTNEIFSE